MIVHFIASKGNITEEIEYYQSIIDNVKKLGHTLAYDWVEEAYESAKKGNVDEGDADWRQIDEESTAAISKADVVIVEATRKSFFVGYRVAQAMHQKKPILVLVRDDSFPGAAQLGSTGDVIYSANYTKDNLHDVIERFLKENTIETKDMRFNFFIDRQIYNYLRWASFKTGRTKAEVLRELVQREIEKRDE